MQLRVSVLALAVAACSSSSPRTFSSVCDEPSPPPECSAGCDPARGSQDCPVGFHCSAGGHCDAECMVATDDCGAGYYCTGDGYCLPEDPAGPDASCPAVHFQAMQTTPAIQLLIDRSTSMLDPIDPAGTITKYEAVRAALVDASGIVTSLQSRAYFGASLYTYLDTPCPELRSVARAKQNRAAIANLIDTTSPMGATPTGPAIDDAVASFAAAPPPATSPRFIVLATDGLPNRCPGDTVDARVRSVAAAQAAFAAGIRLFVLGVDASLPPAHLQDLANAGAGSGNAPYYLATSPQQLTTAFDQIIGNVVSCELAIAGKVDPAAAATGTVELNGQPIGYGVGWTLASTSTLRLLGAACTTLKTTPNATVDATFPCGAVLQ